MSSPETSPPLRTHAVSPSPAPATDSLSPSAGCALWHGAWTAPVMRPSAAPWFETWAEQGFTNQSLRQTVRVHTGGTQVRIRLSNAWPSRLLLSGGSVGDN